MATHVNAYKEEAVKALSKAHDALEEAEQKVQALINKYEETPQVPEVEQPAVNPETAPVSPPVPSPENTSAKTQVTSSTTTAKTDTPSTPSASK